MASIVLLLDYQSGVRSWGKARTYLVQLRRLLLTLLSSLLLWPGQQIVSKVNFQKRADGGEDRHTSSVRRPFSATFRITYASSYVPVTMCRIPRIKSRTPVEDDRAVSTVASGPNQVGSLYLRTSSRIPSLGTIRVDGIPSRGGLFLAVRMAVVGHQDAAQCFLVGQFFPFRFVKGQRGRGRVLGVSALELSRRRPRIAVKAACRWVEREKDFRK